MKTFLWASVFVLIAIFVVMPEVSAQEWTFTRGDLNGDGDLAINDPLILLNFLFLPGAQTPICLDAADFDDDGALSLIDGIDFLTYMFANGPEPAPPFGACGVDPTPDPLTCLGPLAACPPATLDPPSSLVATAISGTQIDLTWQDNTTIETAFQIERSITGIGGPYSLWTVVGADVTSYSDVDLIPAFEYCYRVRALTDATESDPSNESCATTDDAPSPLALVAFAVSDGQIDLNWQDLTGETGYQVERSVGGSGGPFNFLASVGADVSSYSDSNLMPATQYCYRVRGVFDTVFSDYSNVNCASTDDPPPPAAPSGLTATAVSGTEVQVAWQDNSNDETGFEVQRSSTGPGGPYATIGSVGPNATMLLDQGVNPVTEYCYRVRAVHGFGASGFSNTDCDTTPQPPEPIAPSNLVLVPVNDDQIDLSWIDNSTNETGFQIERSEAGSGGPFQLIAILGADAVALSDTGLAAATEFCYRVRAVNQFGQSDYTSVACAFTAEPPPPAAPTALNASVASSTSIDLTWIDNSDNETEFSIERSDSGIDGSYFLLASAAANATFYTDPGLVPGSEYCYRVRAVHPFGASGASNSDCDFTPTLPAAPDTAVATTLSDTEISVTWVDNSTDETGFEVERSTNGIGGPYVFRASVTANSTFYTDSFLSAATQYCYRVRAVHGFGASDYSNEDCATTENSPPPEAPTNLSATHIFPQTEILVEWEDNSLTETAFHLERSTSGPFGPWSLVATPSSNVRSYQDLDLVPGQEYCYRVKAVSQFGSSPYSNVVCRTPDELVAMEADEIEFAWLFAPAYQQIDRSRVNLLWEDQWGDETGFEIERSTNGPGGPFAYFATVPPNVVTFFDSHRMALTEYCYRVRALRPGGPEPYMNVACVTTLSPPPSKMPSGLTSTLVGESQVDLRWSDNATVELGFEIWRSVNGGQYEIIGTVLENTQTFTDNTVEPGGTYCYQVRSFNEWGESNFTGQTGGDTDACITTAPLPPPPNPPTSLVATADFGAVNLDWVDNSNNETGFEIDRSISGPAGPYALFDTVAANVTSYLDFGLTPGQEYCYRVRAINTGGQSGYTNNDCATAQALPPPPAAPTNLVTAENGPHRVDLVWTDASANEIGFEIERSGNGVGGPFNLIAIVDEDETSYSDESLFPQNEYCYRVRAFNAGGPSTDSNTSCSTTTELTDPTMIAAYGFDEGSGTFVEDVTGHGHDGTLENGASRNNNGQFGECAEFDGVSGNVDLGSFDVTGSELTISGWFRADDFGTSDARIISKATGLSNSATYWMVSTVDSGDIHLRFRLRTNDGTTTQLISSAVLSINDWYHFAVVYDGTQMAIYLDGVLAGSVAKFGQLVADPNADVWIGANPIGGRVFDGRIDNVRVYERALPLWEIQLDMTTDVQNQLIQDPPVAPSGLIAVPSGSGTGIDLSWVDNATTEATYEVERSADGFGGPYFPLVSLPQNTQSYSDEGLEPNTEYCYRVRSVNVAAPSNYSNSDCATPSDIPPPPPPPPPGQTPHLPDHLNITVFQVWKVQVTWRDNSDNETGFELQRKVNGGPFETITVAPAGTRHVVDLAVSEGNEYCYRVRAINDQGTSPWTAQKCKSTVDADIKVKKLFDTPVIEVSGSGPNVAPGTYGSEAFETKVDFDEFDWTSPVDFVNGQIFHRLDILERPSMLRYRAKMVMNEPGVNGDHWWPQGEWARPVEPLPYKTIHNVNQMRDDTNLIPNLDDPPDLRMHYATEYQGANAPWGDSRFHPFYARFTWVVVGTGLGGIFPGWGTIVGTERPIIEPFGLPLVESYVGPITVTMTTSTRNSWVRYTTDGTEPSPTSPLYTGPFQITNTTTIKAKAYNPGLPPSDTTTNTIAIEPSG